ncbi:MAG: hypothetical protein VX956_01915 [Gemmatimonadota bacterium]|nr:hypothetical protein [Gemmatimonadota bacterium]
MKGLLRVIGTLLMIWGVVVLWDVRLEMYFYWIFEESGPVIVVVGVVILLVGIVLHLFETTNSPTQEILDGPVETFHNNGQLRVKGTKKNGKWDGLYEIHYENGGVMEKGTYTDGKKCGEWLDFGGKTVTYPPC